MSSRRIADTKADDFRFGQVPVYPRYPTLLLLFLLLFAHGAGAVAPPHRVGVLALFKDKALLSVDGRRYLLEVGEAGPFGIRLLSANSRRAVLVVGGEYREVRPETRVIELSRFTTSPTTVRLAPDANGTYVTQGRIDGRPVNFIVDTGASVLAIGDGMARSLGVDYRSGERVKARTAAGEIPAWVVRLSRVEVGGIVLHDVEAAVVEDFRSGPALLGMSFLRRVRMEYRNGLLLLSSTSSP